MVKVLGCSEEIKRGVCGRKWRCQCEFVQGVAQTPQNKRKLTISSL
jgi:hypothetical protein